MAKKQNKKENSPILNLDGEEYQIDDMNDDHKLMVSHVSDLNRKIENLQFQIAQMSFGRQAFIDALKTGLNKDGNKD